MSSGERAMVFLCGGVNIVIGVGLMHGIKIAISIGLIGLGFFMVVSALGAKE